MLRMDEFNKIRKEFHVKGKSLYQISREYRRSWATIKTIVEMPDSKIIDRGKRPGRPPIVLTPEVLNKIHSFLDFEVLHNVHKKQRFTATYIYNKLKEDGTYQGSAKSIRTAVARLRKDRALEKKSSFLDLDFEFGNYLQVDHGPAEVNIDGERIDGYLFTGSIPGYCLRFCQFYPTKAQEAWGQFHELMFNFFGGVTPTVIYDNDSVLKINKTNEETAFCMELQIHYKFKAEFCNKAAGWEKGAVENAVGYCRRNFLAGLQSFESIDKLNGYLEDKCLNDILSKEHYLLHRPLCDLYDELRPKLKTFTRGKVWGKWDNHIVDNFQHITYQGRYYSVPERYIGSSLKVFISLFAIDIYDGHNLVYSHERLYLRKNHALIPDHYLDQLLQKPRAIKHSKALNDYSFDDNLQKLRRMIELRHDEKEAGKEFVKILLLKRTSTRDDFDYAVGLAIEYNSATFQGVKSILQQLQVEQKRVSVKVNYPTIDNTFCLNKYAELEHMETSYD